MRPSLLTTAMSSIFTSLLQAEHLFELVLDQCDMNTLKTCMLLSHAMFRRSIARMYRSADSNVFLHIRGCSKERLALYRAQVRVLEHGEDTGREEVQHWINDPLAGLLIYPNLTHLVIQLHPPQRVVNTFKGTFRFHEMRWEVAVEIHSPPTWININSVPDDVLQSHASSALCTSVVSEASDPHGILMGDLEWIETFDSPEARHIHTVDFKRTELGQKDVVRLIQSLVPLGNLTALVLCTFASPSVFETIAESCPQLQDLLVVRPQGSIKWFGGGRLPDVDPMTWYDALDLLRPCRSLRRVGLPVVFAASSETALPLSLESLRNPAFARMEEVSFDIAAKFPPVPQFALHLARRVGLTCRVIPNRYSPRITVDLDDPLSWRPLDLKGWNIEPTNQADDAARRVLMDKYDQLNHRPWTQWDREMDDGDLSMDDFTDTDPDQVIDLYDHAVPRRTHINYYQSWRRWLRSVREEVEHIGEMALGEQGWKQL